MGATSKLCDRAREWTSLRLDDELSEIESALLEAHLARCDECRGFAAAVSAFTAELRRSPLLACRRPVTLPARGRATVLTPLRLGAAAAAAVAVIAVTSVLSAIRSDGGLRAPVVIPSSGEVYDIDRDLRDVRRKNLKLQPYLRRIPKSLDVV